MEDKRGDAVLAANVKALREKRGLTQDRLAEISGLSLNMVQKIEAAERYGRKETHQKIAAALGVTVSQLLNKPEGNSGQGVISTSKNPDEPEYLAFLSVDPNLPESERELISDIIRRRYAEAKRNAEELSKIPPGINRPARIIKPE